MVGGGVTGAVAGGTVVALGSTTAPGTVVGGTVVVATVVVVESAPRSCVERLGTGRDGIQLFLGVEVLDSVDRGFLGIRIRETGTKSDREDRHQHHGADAAQGEHPAAGAVRLSEVRDVPADGAVTDRRLDVPIGEFGQAERQRHPDQHPPEIPGPEAGVGREPFDEPADVLLLGDDEDRIVPEVEAVRPQADPRQQADSQVTAEVAPRMDRRRDHDDRGEVDEQEAEAEDALAELERGEPLHDRDPTQESESRSRTARPTTPPTSSTTRAPGAATPRSWRGAQKNASADPRSKPDSRVGVA